MTSKEIAVASIAVTIILAVGGAAAGWAMSVQSDVSGTKVAVESIKSDVREMKETLRLIAPPTVPRMSTPTIIGQNSSMAAMQP